MELVYSTPTDYINDIHKLNRTYPTKLDDFIPYADKPHAYWTGYYTSRPTLKYNIKERGRYF